MKKIGKVSVKIIVGVALCLSASMAASDAQASTIKGRVTLARVTSGGTRVTINLGGARGLKKGSKVYFLQGSTRRYLRRAGKRVSFRCESVTTTECTGKVAMTLDNVKANPKVQTTGRRVGQKAKRFAKVLVVRHTTDRRARVVINRGQRSGLRKGSKVYFLRGTTGRYLTQGGRRVSFRCESVSRNECSGIVKLTIDQVKANRYVKPRA